MTEQTRGHTLDTERLARALKRLPSSIGSMYVEYSTDDPLIWRREPIAQAIAREYDALAPSNPPARGGYR